MAENQEIVGPVSQEDIEIAEKLKNEANEYFKSKYFIARNSLMISNFYAVP